MSASRTVICLLRNDLRLHDNEVFHWAQRNADHIIPLYCFDPRHYQGTYHFNFPKTGPFRLRFLLDSVKDLRATLKKRGSTLLVRQGKPEEVVSELIQQLGSVTALAFHEEVASEEKFVEKKLKDVLPDVYTQFRKAVEGQGRVRPVLSTPEQVKSLPLGLEEGPIPTFEGLGQTEPVDDCRSAFPCRGLRWAAYHPGISMSRLRSMRSNEPPTKAHTGLQDKHVSWKTDMILFNAWKGFMSNRGRQNVASFLTKDLGLDWRLGAEWFEYLLVDHDVCSNYGNWLYSAGTGNDPRENRKFNMIKQGLDYDNNGDYVRQWVPELRGIKGGDVHTPWTLSNSALSHAQVSLNETYPSPIIIAPEWSRHINNKSSGPPGKGRKGSSYTPRQHKDRGIDFYFSKNKGF
ncbi:Cryptochrome DASH [Labeo rohita]|uniref:Cryptochrome DASH n=1 Tax=Labeo rohita TaxID=84645 RepID=A0ABQ8LFB7_LABRO|nr:Cryptochrome DASH [Labeo rohita]